MSEDSDHFRITPADRGQDNPSAPPQGETRRVRLRVDASEVKSTYANAFQTSAARDEVVLELGFNRVMPSPPEREGEEPGVEIRLELGHRVIMTYPSLKRFAIAVGQMVRGYEEKHGKIELEEDQEGRRNPSR